MIFPLYGYYILLRCNFLVQCYYEWRLFISPVSSLQWKSQIVPNKYEKGFYSLLFHQLYLTITYLLQLSLAPHQPWNFLGVFNDESSQVIIVRSLEFQLIFFNFLLFFRFFYYTQLAAALAVDDNLNFPTIPSPSHSHHHPTYNSPNSSHLDSAQLSSSQPITIIIIIWQIV